ncbi:UDP-glucose 4-epimerase [wastewater metagenome]|uniref:UDP-glucose 4-epimerase n=2 Tax=unclassified sequences TaxID=12908 RepID=A0A5B8RHH3_9ZZZZ|nr:SDR family oxidoreductase [Arhodomonas sp. KWT]QEA06934.1 UDP-glucose 4-epimerase [uncultured organism]
MDRVLVTGGGGYIGCVLVPELLDRGYDVRVLDRFFFGRELLPTHPRLKLIREDSRRLRPEHLAGVDHVIDLVALSNDPSGELFENATWQINHTSRVHTAHLAKQLGVKRYILPSSCSVYGFQDETVHENSPVNPLTTYARANRKAEEGILPLADERFCAIVLRQATVYGYSPRMRFDLAINGMTHGAWATGKLPLLRDGNQWRPMVHVHDTVRAMVFMLETEPGEVSGEIFNVGSDANNYQLRTLAEAVAGTIPTCVEINWYGDPDHRSYKVSFRKLEALGFKARYEAEDGVREIHDALEQGRVEKTDKTITLKWYQNLVAWHRIIRETDMHGGIIDLDH